MTAIEWGALWGLLNERFSQNRSPELAAFYFTELTSVLSDVQMKAGVRRTLVSARYFPSPEEIMSAAGMSPEASALAEWDVCHSMMEGSRTAYDRLTETGKKLVRLLGGEQALRNSPLDSLPFIRKEWLKLYADANEIDAHERQMLAPMSPEGRKLLAAAMAGQDMPGSSEAAD